MVFRGTIGIALVILVSSGDAAAERLRMEIDSADFRPYPVAAPAAISLSGNDAKTKAVTAEATAILQGGIELIRAFALVPPKSYLAPKNEPWTTPIYQNWINVGASGLVRCAVKIDGAAIELGFRFYDVVSQREMLYKSYPTTKAKLVGAVHRFLDELTKALTGEPGIFASRIIFVRRTKQGKAVYMSRIDGRGVGRLTDPEALSILPSWDKRGQFVMFTSYLKGNPDLYRKNLSTGKLEWLSKKRGLNTGAAVSPDGKKIALTLSVDGNTEIYVMDWNGKNLRRLTDSWGQDVSASWSPDGKQIAFVSSRSGQPHIYVMNRDGSNQKRLTFQGNYNQEPCWSPRADGEIVFTARDENLNYDIFLVNPATGVITRLTQDEGHKNESPTFSPDGLHVLFTSNRPPQRGKKLYVMDVDGRNQRRISREVGDYETPAWGPRIGYD